MFFSENSYPEREIPHAVNEKYGKTGALLTSQYPGMIYNSLNIPADNVFVKMWSLTPYPIKVKVLFSDDTYLDRVPACEFILNPADTQNSYTCRILSHGNIQTLSIMVDPSTIRSDVMLTQVVINHRPYLDISSFRVLLLSILSFLLISGIRYKWHRLTTDHLEGHKKTLVSCIVPCLALLMTYHVFTVFSPYNCHELSVFQSGGYIVENISPPDHKLLHPLPDTQDLRFYDRYTILLHALLHHRLSLDLPVDPQLAAMENPYSPSQRAALGVKHFYDYAFYKGKYYCYFGLAPVLVVYLPIYAITGKVPTLALTGFILVSLLTITLSLAFHSLFAAIIRKCNLLLYLGVQTAFLCTCGLWLFQSALMEYNFPVITALIFTSLAAACCWSLLNSHGLPARCLLLFCAGLCVPLIVMSRPLILFFAICLCAPPLLSFLAHLPIRKTATHLSTSEELAATTDNRGADHKFQGHTTSLKLIPASLIFGVPVIIGATIVMAYNYYRFGSVYDFGAFYNLTGYDMPNISFKPSLPSLHAMIFHYFFEQPDLIKNFPFITSPSHSYSDFGKPVYLVNRVALFAWPLLWFLPLALWKGTFKPDPALDNGSAVSVFKLTTCLTCVVLPVLVYLDSTTAGYSYRYMGELTMPVALVSAFLLLRFFREIPISGTQVLLFIVLSLLLLKTVLMSLLLPFTIDQVDCLSHMNADHYVLMSRILSPFNF
ncbi:MAG: hypothetical protein IJ228_08555 [Succinivibrio sp.]|nr:hypothetical protein [Succinivibrio sp.]